MLPQTPMPSLLRLPLPAVVTACRARVVPTVRVVLTVRQVRAALTVRQVGAALMVRTALVALMVRMNPTALMIRVVPTGPVALAVLVTVNYPV